MFLIPRRQVLTGPPQGGVPELAQEWAGKVRKVVFNGVLPKGVVAGSTISRQVTKFGTSLVQPSRVWNYSVGSEYAIDLGARPNSATFLIVAERNCDCNVDQNIPFIMNCATLGDGGVGIAMGNWWNSPIHRNKVHAGSGDLWIGGVFQSLVPSLSDNEVLADTPYTIVNSISTMTGGEYKLFAKDDSVGGYVSPVKIHLFVELDLQSPESAKSLSANPWQIFKRPDSRIFVPVSAGGSTLNASASGSAQASGAASLAAQIALSAVGVSTASGTANASGSINIPLSATGLAVSAGTANPSATITISAAGLAQAAGSAGLSAAVLLAGAGAAQAAGNAALATKLNALASGTAQAAGTANLTGGAPGALSATGQAQATGSATLKITIALQAIGAAQATGAAQLTSGTQGQIAATGQAQATGTAYPTVKVAAQAAGQAQASGSAAATTQTGNQITGLGHADASGTATLSVIATLTASGFVRAMGAGGLNIEVPLAATGLAAASGTAALAIVPDYIPQAPLQLIAIARHLARLNHAVSRQITLRHKVTRVIH